MIPLELEAFLINRKADFQFGNPPSCGCFDSGLLAAEMVADGQRSAAFGAATGKNLAAVFG